MADCKIFQRRPTLTSPITYDRTKVAEKIYNMISNNGLVIIKKIDGGSYVTTTKKGDDESEGLLEDLGAYMNSDSEEPLVAYYIWN
jgi:hypothetical protein